MMLHLFELVGISLAAVPFGYWIAMAPGLYLGGWWFEWINNDAVPYVELRLECRKEGE